MSFGIDQRKIILASSSPRRRTLMAEAGLRFRTIVPDIAEEPQPGEQPCAFARRAAREKAEAVHARLPPPAGSGIRVVIGCDTIVALGPRILGKPADPEEATAMLHSLSGRTHEVMSGLCLVIARRDAPARRRVRLVRTEVRFRRLSGEEIRRYVAGGESMDKAGAYAIQGGAAGMVRWICGSYTNVVGLPLAELLALLQKEEQAS